MDAATSLMIQDNTWGRIQIPQFTTQTSMLTGTILQCNVDSMLPIPHSGPMPIPCVHNSTFQSMCFIWGSLYYHVNMKMYHLNSCSLKKHLRVLDFIRCEVMYKCCRPSWSVVWNKYLNVGRSYLGKPTSTNIIDSIFDSAIPFLKNH